ncbi:UNVERIFIED_CONTAM: hypothetical protein GTU68_033675 [Idotea baltica]|nr:hypothetical protein [Idotea baltica]
MTWIKICGITSPAAAVNVVECGPSAIGLNFYPPSPRCVTPSVACSIRKSIADGIEVIGVFVNESPEAIAVIADEVGLTGVQLHGDETPADIVNLRQLVKTNVCKAFRIEQCELQDATPDRILVDARVKGVYGGSGERVDWSLVAVENRKWNCPPMILAGGLTAENVAEAIQTTSPWGVDVASGVEDESGEKNVSLVKQFVHNAIQQNTPPTST